MQDNHIKAICDILKYIKKRPNAIHTEEGIAKYWIFQQRIEEKLEIVIPAIEYLVKEGFLEKIEKKGIRYLKVNKKKMADVSRLLEKLKDAQLELQ